MTTELEALYDQDFYAWICGQAKALRTLEAERWNGPLDLARLAEEVEDLAKAERNAVISQTKRLIEHLLKLTHSRQDRPRRQWIISVDDARSALEQHLTPTLRRDLEASLAELYRRERKRTARKLTLFKEPDAAAALPEDCPFTVEQLLDEDWWPDAASDLEPSPEGA